MALRRNLLACYSRCCTFLFVVSFILELSALEPQAPHKDSDDHCKANYGPNYSTCDDSARALLGCRFHLPTWVGGHDSYRLGDGCSALRDNLDRDHGGGDARRCGLLQQRPTCQHAFFGRRSSGREVNGRRRGKKGKGKEGKGIKKNPSYGSRARTDRSRLTAGLYSRFSHCPGLNIRRRRMRTRSSRTTLHQSYYATSFTHFKPSPSTPWAGQQTPDPIIPAMTGHGKMTRQKRDQN
jgi:hypothetical protein